MVKVSLSLFFLAMTFTTDVWFSIKLQEDTHAFSKGKKVNLLLQFKDDIDQSKILSSKKMVQ
jgi:hypothetical protein